MKLRPWIFALSAASLLSGPQSLTAATTPAELDASLAKIAAGYTQRIETATAELNSTRERIATEKVPLLNSMRAVEDRILTLRAEVAKIKSDTARFANDLALREQEAGAQRLNVSFFAGAAAEGLSSLSSSLGNVEVTHWQQPVDALRARLDPASGIPDIDAAVETAELLAQRLDTLLGGYTAPGQAVSDQNHTLVNGRFVFLGPETYFAGDGDSAVAGTVRARDEGAAPIVYALPGWDHAAAVALADGRATTIQADVSGGKALQLRENQGDWIDHINKGGVVGYTIIGLGFFAVLTAILKLVDLRKLAVDAPAATIKLLEAVATGGAAAAQPLLAGLRDTSAALFTTGLRHLHKPKEVIEEHLHAFILRERLHHERWLPMLAVIAAASPLLGLLGTVVGMVKTFTLITVFGTGNAGKLSSGISEALVTTELGLIVAIPALVLHGFLSYRTQKSLSLLERYAVELVTASEDHKVAAAPAAGSLPA